MIYTFSPFGYDGNLIQIKSDVRNGVKALDLIGISDSYCKESKRIIETVIADSYAIKNRCLISCSPVGIQKFNECDFAIALELINYNENLCKYLVRDFDILALGILEENGNIKPIQNLRKSIETFVKTETENLLKVVICSKEQKKECENIDENLLFLFVDNFSEVKKALEKRLANNKVFKKLEYTKSDSKEVIFNDIQVDSNRFKGLSEEVEILAIAIAGKHHILASGNQGSGRTLIFTDLVQYFTPKLTDKENDSVLRVRSSVGLPYDTSHKIPFRMPHETASIEGMCGGGIRCRAGEITLAHNGVLFLDEANEFRASVIQILRVPMMSGYITLSRAGRNTIYPAGFQLMMSLNNCLCGKSEKDCLCSKSSITQYWNKISTLLLNRIPIKMKVERKDDIIPNLETLKEQIKTAYEMQRERNIYNEYLSAGKLEDYCEMNLTDEQKKQFEEIKNKCLDRQFENALKVARTIADMDGREKVDFRDFQKAIELGKNKVNF